MDERTTSVASDESSDEAVAPATDDLLVEEVSIDGMCGVY